MPQTQQPETQTQPESETSTPVDEPTVTEPETVTVPPETTTAPVKKEALIVTPTDEANWFLSIINSAYKLPDKYVPALAAAVEGSAVQLDARVAPYYQQMYAAAKSAGCILTPYSGYRSFASQDSTYTRKINYYLNQGLSQEEATAKTLERVLPAGCSENNAGLSMDIVSASSDFMNTKEYKWLLDNAQNYGFVLRYPESKQDKTGMVFQPWHWRYVGEAAAKEMKQNGQCLEEYLGLA